MKMHESHSKTESNWQASHEHVKSVRSVQGKYFYRIIDRFIDQTGADVESIFGGPFKDDPGGLKLVHDRPGLMSCANLGPDTTTSHFSTMVWGSFPAFCLVPQSVKHWLCDLYCLEKGFQKHA